MSDYPGVTKAELEKDIAPVVRKWLEDRGHHLDRGRDEAGHCVYSFGVDNNPGDMGAYVVYEGEQWTLDFIEDMDGGIDAGDRTYEIEAYSSYEMNVTILDDYR